MRKILEAVFDVGQLLRDDEGLRSRLDHRTGAPRRPSGRRDRQRPAFLRGLDGRRRRAQGEALRRPLRHLPPAGRDAGRRAGLHDRRRLRALGNDPLRRRGDRARGHRPDPLVHRARAQGLRRRGGRALRCANAHVLAWPSAESGPLPSRAASRSRSVVRSPRRRTRKRCARSSRSGSPAAAAPSRAPRASGARPDRSARDAGARLCRWVERVWPLLDGAGPERAPPSERARRDSELRDRDLP